MENIFVLVSAATTFAKFGADVLNMAWPERPRWTPPLVAVLIGILALLLLFVADGLLITPALAAQAILAGSLAGGAAVGVTELHQKAREN